MSNVYWTMKNGQKIDVDDMDINHLRNTLKMIIRNIEKQRKETKSISNPYVQIRGEIAQDMLDQAYLNELEDDFDMDKYYGSI